MKTLIGLVLIAYGISIVIETSSTYVPSSDKSKSSIEMRPPSQPVMPEPPIQQQQFHQNEKKEYVQGEVGQLNQQQNNRDYGRPMQNDYNDDDINDSDNTNSNNQENVQFNNNGPIRNPVYQNGGDNDFNRPRLNNKKRRYRMSNDYY